MSDLLSTRSLIIFAVFVLAGGVKGVTGMGLPTVTMGLLGTMMAPVTAASLLIVPSFVTNVWQLFLGPSIVGLARRLWPMMVALVIGTLAGSRLLTSANASWATFALGATLVLSSVYSLVGRPPIVPPRAEPWLAPLVGLATGVISGGTGVSIIPAVPYLQALGFDKEELIQALGLSFTVSTIALAIGLVAGGAFHTGSFGASTLALAPAVLGLWIGQTVRQRISPQTFRRWFLSCLILLGVELMARCVV